MGAHDHDHDHVDRDDGPLAKLPVPDEVQDAIRTLIRWSGDDPSREGLYDTPARVARASGSGTESDRRSCCSQPSTVPPSIVRDVSPGMPSGFPAERRAWLGRACRAPA